ncbi:MAG: ATP synthase F1 subunit delta [bacterium]|nr:ATP synthase F1 subunit delta [bacterium]
MSKLSIARRYARALFELSHGEEKSEAVLEEMAAWQSVFEENPDVLATLVHPEIPAGDKESVIASVKCDETLSSFMKLLVDNGRLFLFDEVVDAFRDMLFEAKSRVSATITTAVPLPPDTWREYNLELSRLTGKKIDLRNEVEPGVIGGVRLQIGDRVVDETLAEQLNEIKELMTGNSGRE